MNEGCNILFIHPRSRLSVYLYFTFQLWSVGLVCYLSGGLPVPVSLSLSHPVFAISNSVKDE